MYKKILVPYDTSKPADSALKHAVELAKACSGTITILHVVPEIPIYPVLEHAIRSRKDGKHTAFEEHVNYVYSALKEHILKILEDKKSEYEKNTGLKNIEVGIVQGRPVDKIREYADSNDMDLIIMESSGFSGIAKLKALGSVSRGVLERSKCPVMMLHN